MRETPRFQHVSDKGEDLVRFLHEISFGLISHLIPNLPAYLSSPQAFAQVFLQVA